MASAFTTLCCCSNTVTVILGANYSYAKFDVKKKPLVLLILDGWGHQENTRHNAIAAAHTPQWDQWWRTQPHMLLDASGSAVGLPNGQMGNSEVGHMHIGAGRALYQDFTRINLAIQNADFFSIPLLTNTIAALKKNGKNLHVMGLLSTGGVHSHASHLYAILQLCSQLNFSSVFLHLFLDGRDRPPQNALNDLQALQEVLDRYPVATIASISGRYFAMDRDNRWDRIALVYHQLTHPIDTFQYTHAAQAVSHYYAVDIYDEFIPPTSFPDHQAINDGDSLFFFNFRADRARQLTHAFLESNFTGFNREDVPKLNSFISMTRYSESLPTQSVFPPVTVDRCLGEVLAEHKLTQLRIAETEKYAHVTFFFNGGSEQVFSNEERILIPSPNVATYDLQPEMNAELLTTALVNAIESSTYDVIICNYANADMVGHTGNFPACVAAIECLDRCMQKVGQAVVNNNGVLLITADHGNAETMFNDAINQPHTAHTCESVPLLLIGDGWNFSQECGSLRDIAPTMLRILDISAPQEMTGTVLVSKRTHAV